MGDTKVTIGHQGKQNQPNNHITRKSKGSRVTDVTIGYQGEP